MKNFYVVSLNMNNVGVATVDLNGDDLELKGIEVLMHVFNTMGFGSLQDYFNHLPGFSGKDELKFYKDYDSFKLYLHENSRKNYFHLLFIDRGVAEELIDINLLTRYVSDDTYDLMFNIQPTLEDCRMCCGTKIKWNDEAKEKFFFCSDWDFEEGTVQNGITD